MANSTASSSVPTWALGGACAALAAAFALSLYDSSNHDARDAAMQQQLAAEVATRTHLQLTASSTSHAQTAQRLSKEGFDVQFIDDAQSESALPVLPLCDVAWPSRGPGPRRTG